MTFGSLFAGIGGFDLGLERAGMTCRWQVEIDPFCRAVLEKHWPDVRRYEDVREVGSGTLEPVDLICGGFPCQDLSSAGKRAGIDGERSGLWREFVRVVHELQPRAVIVENVHHSWRQWVPVLRGALHELGYASLPIRLRASDFGAWHERSRVFVVAHTDTSILRLESWRRGWPFWTDAPLFADVDSSGRSDREGRGADAELSWLRSAPADVDAMRELQPQGIQPDERRRTRDGSWWAPEPDVVRVVYGVSSRLDGRRIADRVAALGNSVVPIEVEWLGRQFLQAERAA